MSRFGEFEGVHVCRVLGIPDIKARKVFKFEQSFQNCELSESGDSSRKEAFREWCVFSRRGT